MHILSRNKQIGWIETGLYQPDWKIDTVITMSEEWKTGYSHGIGKINNNNIFHDPVFTGREVNA